MLASALGSALGSTAGCSASRPPALASRRTTAAALPAGSGPSFTIAATGDVLAHHRIVAAARVAAGGRGYDFRPLLAPLRPILTAADLALCHLETPLSPDDRRISFYPVFSSPKEIAPALKWAGYDGCTTASNHTLDQGLAGVRSTLDALDAAGVAHTGAARTAAEQRPRVYLVHGVRVAHLDYTYGLNGLSLPAAAPWVVRLIDVPHILADAHAARVAGAQFVIVGLHWGQEYSSPATAEQRQIARVLLASPDVDLLLGCHAHVVQPVERIEEPTGAKYVVYGMGNLLAHHAVSVNTPPTRDGVLVMITVSARAGRYVASAVTYTPTYVDQDTSRVYPVPGQLRSAHLSAATRATLLASWRRTVARVSLLGAAAAGVRPADVPPGVPSS